MPEMIEETPLLFQSGGGDAATNPAEGAAPAATPDMAMADTASEAGAPDATSEPALPAPAAPDGQNAHGGTNSGTPADAGTGANPAASADSPIDYGDFGFGEDAHIDRQSDDYIYYADLFRQIGLSPEQANRLLRGHRDYATAQLAARQQEEAAQLAAYRARVRQELVSECGGEAAFKRFGETALRGFRACAAGAGLNSADVDGIVSVMGDDPRFVKIFHHIGRLHQEDVLAGGSGGGQEPSFDDMLRTMFHTNRQPQE